MSGARRIVLFDFDGTLADSLGVVIPIYNEVAAELGLRPLADGDVERLRRMGAREALRAQRVPLWRLPQLAGAVRARLHARMDEVQPFPGIREALATLRDAGCRTGILTSNARENVDAFFDRHALPRLELARCGASLFGKAPLLRALIEGAGATPAEVVYVGDEGRDITAASAVGVRSVAVTWGYAHRDALAAHRPDVLVDTPAELVSALLSR